MPLIPVSLLSPRRRFLSGSALAIACLASLPAHAEEETQTTEGQGEEIVVIAGSYFGGVDAPQPAIATLDEDEIASYGATSLGELVEALGPQTGSARGRGGGGPVVLVNGQRVSGFRELRNYPPEAVKRVEILPEEVAQRYGYRPDQRVVNFILKDNFQSRELEAEYGQPTAGGYHTTEFEATLLRINGPNRFNLNAQLENSSMLTEAERGVIQNDPPTFARDPDPARYRSLVADSKGINIEGTWTRGIGDTGGSFTLNGSFDRQDRLSLRGLDSIILTSGGRSALRTYNPGDPLTSDSRTTTYALAGTFDYPLGDWRLTATVDAGHTKSRTFTDQRSDGSALQALVDSGSLSLNGDLPDVWVDGGRARAITKQDSATSLVTLVGTPLRLPAGDVSATFSGGFDWDRITSTDTRIAGPRTRISRGDLNGGLDLSLPLTSKRENVLGGLGDLTLSLGGGLDHHSDAGMLYDWSAGLTWKPTSKLSVQASYIWREAPPSLTNLGNPQIQLFNEPIYDFATGNTVLATVITGGNPFLKPETQRDIKLSAQWELPFWKDSNFQFEYFRNQSDDVTAAFPLATPVIEAAFPDRFTRGPGGQLLALDRRPITLDSQKWQRIRYGLEKRGTFGKSNDEERGNRGEGGARDPASAMRGGRGPGKRWQLSLYHTIELQNRVTIAPGGPVLDLLDGDALSDGAVSRHKVEVEAGFFTGVVGGRLRGNYRSPTRIDGNGFTNTGTLHFGSLATVDLRLFLDLGRAGVGGKESQFFKDMRVFLKVDNLFNTRQSVRDENGETPLRYQKMLNDPIGRFVSIQLRKIF